jgi:hypothetical protein
LTSLLARVALTAIYPQYLPISLIIPTPYSADSASVYAESINLIDSATAVLNPKLLSIKGMSLSIVLGIPQIEIFIFFSLNYC